MSLTNLLTPGRLLILTSNLSYALGAAAADLSATHIYNPTWPPHAKFHTGQTITLATLLALTSSYFVFRSALAPTTTDGKNQNRNQNQNQKQTRDRDGEQEALARLFEAAWVGSLYCAAGLCAILYPGTEWMDPEFASPGGMTQKPVFAGIVALIWAGYGIERWRMGGGVGSGGRSK